MILFLWQKLPLILPTQELHICYINSTDTEITVYTIRINNIVAVMAPKCC